MDAGQVKRKEHDRPRGQVARTAILGLAVALGAAWLAPARGAASDAAAYAIVEEVLVTGVQPGPGLWKVTRPAEDGGEHVLWIMGQYRTLPIQLYARWLALKAEYLGYDQDIEQWRPIFAAFKLYGKAVERAGLMYSPVVWSVAKKSAKKHRVKITTPTLVVNVGKPRALIREFKEAPIDDLPCFASTLERLESDLVLLRARANAWAIGDIATSRRCAR